MSPFPLFQFCNKKNNTLAHQHWQRWEGFFCFFDLLPHFMSMIVRYGDFCIMKIFIPLISRHKDWCMTWVLNFLIRYFSNYYTLHRSDLAARAAPLDPRLTITILYAHISGFCQWTSYLNILQSSVLIYIVKWWYFKHFHTRV